MGADATTVQAGSVDTGGSTRRPRRGLPLARSLAFWFSVVAVFSSGLVGGLTYYLVGKDLRTQMAASLEMLRDEKAGTLGRWIRERTADLRLWSVAPVMKAICEQNAKVAAVDTPTNTAYLESIRSGFGLLDVCLIDPRSGRAMVSAAKEGRTPAFPQAVRERLLRENGVVITDVFRSEIGERPTLLLAGPVRSGDPETVTGILAFYVDLENDLYPILLESRRLGSSGEIVLVNREGMVQAPLKYHADAVARQTLHALPAKLGASGQTGSFVADDYRGIPVVAAYGHVSEVGWGLVAKQDVEEVNAPARQMARHVGTVTCVALLTAVLAGFLLAGRISTPAVAIAAAARQIGDGNMIVRAREEGPAEIVQVAASLNTMVEEVSRRMRVSRALSAIYAVAGSHGGMDPLLEALLPRVMDATGSELGTLYLADKEGLVFSLAAAHGIGRDRIVPWFRVSPPDHWLATVAADGKVRLIADLPPQNDLVIVTHAGEARPRALLAIPLKYAQMTIGIMGFAALHDYKPEHLEIAEAVGLVLGQALSACQAGDETRRMAAELQTGNEELTAANEELAAQAEELQEQADELREQATDLEAQRHKAAEADRLKSEFLSNMSHELRTPLNSILALSQLMSGRTDGSICTQDAEYLRIIERNGRHLLGLINDILDLSKIESGRMDLSLTRFEPGHVVTRAMEIAEPLAHEKGLELKTDVQPGPDIHSDADKIHQILVNMLSNAVKFTDQGTVELSVRFRDSTVCFAVRDTGIGIDPSAIDHIFDEFRQVDGSTTRRHEGTGLGLAIARRLAHLLGGRIDVESLPGKGSTFTLALPREYAPVSSAVSQPPPAGHSRPAPVRTSGGRHRTVLVIDDENTACNVLKGLLEEAGYFVVTANSGDEGLRLAAQLRPFAITLDVLMPGMDGWEVLGELKTREETRRIPVVIVSIRPDCQAGAALGAAACIVKPVNREKLLAELNHIARRCLGGRILVVDDNDIAALQIRTALEQHDYVVIVASGGEQALKCIAEAPPDAVVLDLMMPGVDGFQVLEQIRSDERTAGLPVLVLTAKELTAQDKSRLKHNHIQQLIQKGSVNRDELVAAVAGMLECDSIAEPPAVSLAPAIDPQVPSKNESSDSLEHRNRTILVVEDNADNLATMRAILGPSGHELLIARDGQEAIAMAAAHRPGLILMDVQLPVLSGLEAAGRLKADPALAEIPIVALTARAMRGDRETALAAGCDDYLAKPVDPAEVSNIVAKYLR